MTAYHSSVEYVKLWVG